MSSNRNIHEKKQQKLKNHSIKSNGHHHNENRFLGCCYCSEEIRLLNMLVMVFIFFLVELIIGQITKSISLTTDSFHMLSDAQAILIGLFTVIISSRKSTKNTFGWVRAEVLGPLVNSVFLVSLCIGIVINAIERLFEPKQIEDVDLLLYVGIIGLVINLVGLVLFGHGHSHSVSHKIEDDLESEDDDIKSVESTENLETKQDETEEQLTQVVSVNDEKLLKKRPSITLKNNPKCHILSKEANMNMRAIFLHVLADALGSVIVIISALLNKFQTELNISKNIIDLIDPILCFCLVALILSTTLPLLKESALVLLQTVPKEIEVKQLKHDLVAQISGVLSVHELHIWKLSGKKIIATAHISCHNREEYMQIAAKIKEFFHQKGIHSTTIQPEFIDTIEEALDNCIIECMQNCKDNTCCGQTNEGLITSNTNNNNEAVNCETV